MPVESLPPLTVTIPEGVEVHIEKDTVKVKGPLGELSRTFNGRILEVKKKGDTVEIIPKGARKFHKAYRGTIAAHIRNMITGVTQGFKKKMIMVYSHFPMKIEIDKDRGLILINNFLGERAPRVAKIVGNVKVYMEGDDKIVIEGINIEEVGQTAANIRQATKIKKKDPRVFQDGIYYYPEEV
ncbi:MAG TPA: 50S ribosomal protein L6 [Candidatus Bathyarchaeota archaeon]|nr:50S ribosomal protein L6 [Candidatus Bathyarchaeota archaeon]